MAFFRNLKITLEMIKWEHSIFALPFALCGAMLAAGGLPAWRQLAWIVVAMVSARSAAMAFNRLADASIDAANPRTATRALPVGQLTPAFVSTFVLVACGIFVLAASQLNRLSLMLAPVALAVILLYSYSKRFTRWSHLFLGFALGIAPAAAWIAVRGSLDPRILLLTAAVTFWVGGFDVIYACQDRDYDRRHDLHDCRGRSALLAADRRLEPAVQARGAGGGRSATVVGFERFGEVTPVRMDSASAPRAPPSRRRSRGVDPVDDSRAVNPTPTPARPFRPP